MSLSDLELLQLVDTVKAKQRGPKGEPGVGISSIEQFDETGFTFRLSDGSFKRINLPTPKDGEAGAIGPSGRQGEKGDSGGAGRDGSQGLPGRDGQDGLPGSSIETAVVNSNGHLLLGISDNSIIDVGRVVGPAGATGAVGATGLAGESGKDGAAVLSGPRSPSQDDGVEGDHWIDISSAEFSFYKKNGEGWNKLAELRQVPRDLRVPASGTGGGGSGGGNGELQNTRTLPLINGGDTIRKTAKNKGLPVPGVLITQEDANQYFLGCLREQDVLVSDAVPRPPYQIGQLWFSSNPEELTLYVFDGAVWVPAAPPVSLDGIEASIANVDAELMKVNANIAMNKRDIDEAILDVREDQERQDADLRDLHEKVDGIAEEFDRGKWAHVTEKPVVGQYALGKKVDSQYCQQEYLKCLEEAGDDAVTASKCLRGMEDCEQAATENPDHMVYVDHWGGVDHIAIHTEESDGEIHGFGDYTVGKYIEIINEGDEGNAIYQIVEDAKIENGVAIVKVSDIQATGAPNGMGRFKVFEMKSGDPTDYVRKTGDKMTGQLQIQPTKETTTGFVCYAPAKLPDDNSLSFGAFVNGNGKTVMELKNNGQIWVGDRNFVYTPTKDKSLVNKKYVDEEIAKIEREEDETNARLFGSPYIFRKDKKPDKLASGEFTYDSSYNWYAHRYDAKGDRIGVSSDRNITIDIMFKVYKHNGAINLVCIMHRCKSCKTGQSDNSHFKWEQKDTVYTHTEWLEDGDKYYLSDGFLLP